MSVSPPTPGEPSVGHRGRLLVGAVVAVALVTAALGTWWVRAHDDPAAEPGPSPSPTADANLSELRIERGEFCDRLAVEDVEKALAAPVAGTNHYRSGERTALVPAMTDIAHEYGCRYIAADGTRARVWVFAEPVTRQRARAIARDALRDGCRRLDDGPRFGAPSAGTVCPAPTRSGQEVTRSGLFGDAWLSCQLTTASAEPGRDVVDRSERWCVRVAMTLGARP